MLKRHAKATHPSPRTKTRNLLKGWTIPRKCNNKMKRTLTFHFALLADMKQRFSESKAERESQVFCRFVLGKIIKKYRLRKYATQQLSLYQRRWYADDGFVFRHARPMKPVHNDVEAFYARDDNGRMTTGVKNTITRLKMKKQRRLLTETMKNLHRKFSAESSFTISYTVFCRLRPFWVV